MTPVVAVYRHTNNGQEEEVLLIDFIASGDRYDPFMAVIIHAGGRPAVVRVGDVVVERNNQDWPVGFPFSRMSAEWIASKT